MKKKGFFHLFAYKGGISIIYYICLFALFWYLIIPRTSIYFRDDMDTPLSERLHVEDLVMVKGEVFKLYVVGINKKVRFSSTDLKVADVNIFGRVFAYRTGTTIIQAKYDDVILKCRVRVIDLNKNKLTIKEGNTFKLKVNGPNFKVKWKSKNKKIASVSWFGKVKGISKGSTEIIAECGNKTLICKVNVK